MMTEKISNPWAVTSIDSFNYLCCPECTFRSKKESSFETHAVGSHLKSKVFFNSEEKLEEHLLSDKESIKSSEIKSDDNHVSDTFDIRFTELHNARNQSRNHKDLSDDIEMDPLDSERNELNASNQKDHFEELSIEEFKVETLEVFVLK